MLMKLYVEKISFYSWADLGFSRGGGGCGFLKKFLKIL